MVDHDVDLVLYYRRLEHSCALAVVARGDFEERGQDNPSYALGHIIVIGGGGDVGEEHYFVAEVHPQLDQDRQDSLRAAEAKYLVGIKMRVTYVSENSPNATEFQESKNNK